MVHGYAGLLSLLCLVLHLSIITCNKLQLYPQPDLPTTTTTTTRQALTTVQTLWEGLNATLAAQFPEGKGMFRGEGLFLYNAQVSWLHDSLTSLQQLLGGEQLQVCETGFGVGHSALLFLAHPAVHSVKSFDYMSEQRQLVAEEYVSSFATAQGKTVKIYRGDCRRVVKAFTAGTYGRPQCDLVYTSCDKAELADLQYFRDVSHQHTILAPLANKLLSHTYYREAPHLPGAWQSALQTGLIQQTGECRSAVAQKNKTSSIPLSVHVYCHGKYTQPAYTV
jgi:hypothetical protein